MMLARYLSGQDTDIDDLRTMDANVDGKICKEDLGLLIRLLVGSGTDSDVLGASENSLLVLPHKDGDVIYSAAIELFVDGERTVHTANTGALAIHNIPNGSHIQYNVFSWGDIYRSETIPSFDFDTDGVQVVTLSKPTLSIGGATVSKTIEYVDNQHVDITLSLDSNPGLWGFITRVKFDKNVLTPVSMEAHEMEDFSTLMSPLDGGRLPDTRGASMSTGGVGYSFTTGQIFTIRFHVNEEITHMLPVEIGELDLSAYAPGFPNESRSLYISSCGDIFQPEFGELSEQLAGRTIVGDADNNGRVMSADIELMAKYIVGFNSCNRGVLCGFPCTPRCSAFSAVEINHLAGDIDNDGRISVADCSYLALWIMGYDIPNMPRYIMDYRILVNSAGGSFNDAQTVMTQAENTFRNAFNIHLRRIPGNSTSSNINIGSGCLAVGNNAICLLPSATGNTNNDGCGNERNGSDCSNRIPSRHHRSAHNFLYVDNVDNMETFRFVNFHTCASDSSQSPQHFRVLGSARTGGRDMIVSMPPDDNGNNHRHLTTVHEIGHLLGAGHCSGRACVMNASAAWSQWCDAHRNFIEGVMRGTR